MVQETAKAPKDNCLKQTNGSRYSVQKLNEPQYTMEASD